MTTVDSLRITLLEVPPTLAPAKDGAGSRAAWFLGWIRVGRPDENGYRGIGDEGHHDIGLVATTTAVNCAMPAFRHREDGRALAISSLREALAERAIRDVHAA